MYRRFEAERSRPYDELVARIGAEEPRAVVDLGCGPGELTASLAHRWPGARITGIDSSPEMIAKARGRATAVDFEIGDARDWRPGPDVDVLITNATLQWVPEHRELLDRWVTALPPGAWLAMQVPGNFDAPSHRALRDLAREPAWAARTGDLARDEPVDDAVGYATRLVGLGAAVDAWETTYVHLLPDDGDSHPVLRWMEGTALRPFRAVLDDADWAAFRGELTERLAVAYPSRHGMVAFPFRRIFVVAERQRTESRTDRSGT